MNFPKFKYIIIPVVCMMVLSTITACKKSKEETPEPVVPVTPAPIPTPAYEPKLVFKFKFDSTQVRLNGFGQPAGIASGNSAQSPIFNKMSSHYIELAPNALTQLGSGKVLYHAPETSVGGATAIDFSQSVIKGENQEFYSMKLKDIGPGTFDWLRVSLAYQNYNIKYKNASIYGVGTIASFIGYNTYITNYTINTQNLVVNGNRLQGYWGFETSVSGFNYTSSGQAPAGATTVPNPIGATSPIPAGSCVVTAAFIGSGGVAKPLVITGNETQDIVITVSLSTNKSFEWQDVNSDGIFEPAAGDAVVDMGVRGMLPIW